MSRFLFAERDVGGFLESVFEVKLTSSLCSHDGMFVDCCFVFRGRLLKFVTCHSAFLAGISSKSPTFKPYNIFSSRYWYCLAWARLWTIYSTMERKEAMVHSYDLIAFSGFSIGVDLHIWFWAFGKFPYVVTAWCAMQAVTLLGVFAAVSFWANNRGNSHKYGTFLGNKSRG